LKGRGAEEAALRKGAVGKSNAHLRHQQLISTSPNKHAAPHKCLPGGSILLLLLLK
jgi:hypothetical protein